MATQAPVTEFTRDITGRSVCNTWDEALQSIDLARHPGARPFDMIILGGGTFGSVLATHLFNLDKTHAHRILVLDAGPLLVTEHIQTQPLLAADDIWGVPWDSDSPASWNQKFPGLAYCLGGRSLFWGGWAPYLAEADMPAARWPASVRRDLTEQVLQRGDEWMSHQDDAARQLGTDQTNDFVNSRLHFALRDALFNGLRNWRAATAGHVSGSRGRPMTAMAPPEILIEELEAPLAITSASPRPGAFPFSKFSAIQLLTRVARLAQAEADRGAAGLDDRLTRKRLMVVPNLHVIRLELDNRRITRLHTNRGVIDLPPAGQVFLALGTIENTRLALTTLPNREGLIGRNLMACLPSTLVCRVQRSAFGRALEASANPDLQISALYVKGEQRLADGRVGHYRVQITAAGAGALGMDAEAELTRMLPDLDRLESFQPLAPEWIVVTLRGAAEMFGDPASPDPRNRIALSPTASKFDYGMPRAKVRLDAGPDGSAELELWDAMDRACDELARMLAQGGPVQYLVNGAWQDRPPAAPVRRERLSATHREGGTLWMGDDARQSVTDEWGRFHEADNLYALGPCLLPTQTLPDTMLAGIALTRRTAYHLIPPLRPRGREHDFEYLFDGTEMTANCWRVVGQGSFALIDGTLVAQGGPDLGLLYYTPRTFGDLTLRLEFKLDDAAARGGIGVRFRDPGRPVPERADPTLAYPYANQAYVAVDTGFVVPIDELGRGDTRQGRLEDLNEHRTGAIDGVPIGLEASQQAYRRGPVLQAGRWYELQIDLQDDNYGVTLNDEQTAIFTNTDIFRGQPPESDPDSGYLGLLCQAGQVAFRNIRVRVPIPVAMPALAIEPGVLENVAIVWQARLPADGGAERLVRAPVIQRRRRLSDQGSNGGSLRS